jgi:hypothetical protein
MMAEFMAEVFFSFFRRFSVGIATLRSEHCTVREFVYGYVVQDAAF